MLLRFCSFPWHYEGLPRWPSGKEPAFQCRRHRKHGLDPWVRKIPWSRKWQLTPVFLSGKLQGQLSQWAEQDTAWHYYSPRWAIQGQKHPFSICRRKYWWQAQRMRKKLVFSTSPLSPWLLKTSPLSSWGRAPLPAHLGLSQESYTSKLSPSLSLPLAEFFLCWDREHMLY